MNPYHDWAEARRHAGLVMADEEYGGGFLVSRWEDVDRVLRAADTYSSEATGLAMRPIMGDIIVAMDGAEHRRHRALVAKAFRASALEHWGAELIEPTIQALLDAIAPNGRADLVADVTSRYPVQVIAAILGVPVEDYERFHEWANAINEGPRDFDRSLPAARAMREYLAPIVEDRRRQPTDDLISDLVTAEVDGERLDDARLFGMLLLLLPAGAETTYRVLGSCLAALLTHPATMAEVVADRSLIAAVIEETLRWETSVSVLLRNPVEDVELAGTVISRGTQLVVSVGSANHDEHRWPDPETWDIHRPRKPHLAFGTGPHQCLGMHLARLELTVALDAILERLPNLRADPDAPPPTVEGYPFRSPASLPVRFDPAPVAVPG